MPAIEDVTVRIGADTAPFADALKDLQSLSKSFGSELTGALRGAAVSGKSLESILRQASDQISSDYETARLLIEFAPLYLGKNRMIAPFFEATRRITAAHPAARIVMLTAHGHQSQVQAALRAGAAGYLLKDTPADEVVRAVQAAHAGVTPPGAAG